MTIQEQLVSFAFDKAYPYILEQPHIRDYTSGISFILVGSAATGLCTAGSDVDVCLVCSRDVYDVISVGTRWLDGRPTEVVLDGIQLHYYAVSTDNLEKKIAASDGLAMYVYSNALVIDDTAEHYRPILEKIRAALPQRFECELDMLGRRKRALRTVLTENTDPMTRLELCCELAKRLLTCIALFDGLESDTRKRLYRTALRGPTGKELQPRVDALLALMGSVCRPENTAAANEFLASFDLCFERISKR